MKKLKIENINIFVHTYTQDSEGYSEVDLVFSEVEMVFRMDFFVKDSTDNRSVIQSQALSDRDHAYSIVRTLHQLVGLIV